MKITNSTQTIKEPKNLLRKVSKDEEASLLKNMRIIYHDNPNPKFAGEPNSIAMVPVSSGLDWAEVLPNNFGLAEAGYVVDMAAKGRPQAHNEKQNGCWVNLEDLLKNCSTDKPKEHSKAVFSVYNPKTGLPEERVLLIRKSGVYPYLVFGDVQLALADMGKRVIQAAAESAVVKVDKLR